MGAWGEGNLQNDAARDWLDACEKGEAEYVRKALEAVDAASKDASIETNPCCEALAACEILATAFGLPPPDAQDDLVGLAARVAISLASTDIERAIRVAARISEHSDLQELFDEGGRNTTWHEVVTELVDRLETIARRTQGFPGPAVPVP
jgi:hypothetical protein